MVTRTHIRKEKEAAGPGIPEIPGQDTNPGTVVNPTAFPRMFNREADACSGDGGSGERYRVFRRLPDGGD
jgi:hypothetical protein